MLYFSFRKISRAKMHCPSYIFCISWKSLRYFIKLHPIFNVLRKSSQALFNQYLSFSARSVAVSGCPQLVEASEVRVQVVKAVSPSFRPDMCRDHAVKIAGCRSHDRLEFLISCASYSDVKSMYINTIWSIYEHSQLFNEHLKSSS